MATCICGEEFEALVGKGQIKHYCSDRCRQRAKRSRDKAVTPITISRDNDIVLTEQHLPIKPPLKYPGSKWMLAQWIVQQLPKHTTYLEPFFGSGAVFFNKKPSEYEVINDLDEQVVNLFTVIRDRGDELSELIMLTPYARQEYYRSYQMADDPMENARRFLVRCWQAHGAKTSDRTGWMNRGATAASSTTGRWNKLPERIRAVVTRLKDAEIESVPAVDLLNRFKDASDCLVYCDPPYILSTRNSRLYKHEMTDQDHLKLLDALDDHTGPVVLSGYAHPIYDNRLAHWQRVTTSALAEKGRSRTEVLWLNEKAQRRQLSLFDTANYVQA
jgi:DNA adenine methylase